MSLLLRARPKVPAMRLGFERRPLSYEDVLWPGEWAPKP